MKKTAIRMQHKILTLLPIGYLVISLVSPPILYAATDLSNQLFMTPSDSYMNLGSPITVEVKSYTSSTQSSGSTSGNIVFPANLLRVADNGISTTGSAYQSLEVTQSSGRITFRNGVRSPAPAGTVRIFSVTFQAIGAGKATVGFSDTEEVKDIVNGATPTLKSAVLTITSPNPAQPSKTPVASTTPKPTTLPKPTVTQTVAPTALSDTSEAEPTPTPDPTGLVSNVNTKSLYQTGSITWSVGATNASTSISYGTSSSQLDKKVAGTKKDDGSFTATLSGLTPGNRYYFTISATGDGGKEGSYSATLLTLGYPVTITVTENGSPAKNAQVKIGSRTYSTAANGKVSIGLASGNYSGTITTETANMTINPIIDKKTIPSDGTAPTSQLFSYDLKSSPLEQGSESNFSLFTFLAVLAGGTFILGLGFMGFMAYRRRQFDSNSDAPFRPGSGSTVVIDDGYTWHEDAPIQPPQYETKVNSNNAYTQSHSIAIDNEEPLDMFEKADLEHSFTDKMHTTAAGEMPAAGQNPNLPHSTRL